ncbi:MAG: hypothetical protein ABR566_14155, partial [Pyrinomonadaceae bacterium]
NRRLRGGQYCQRSGRWGIATFDTTVTVTNASITNNHANGSFGFGGGMYIRGGSATRAFKNQGGCIQFVNTGR